MKKHRMCYQIGIIQTHVIIICAFRGLQTGHRNNISQKKLPTMYCRTSSYSIHKGVILAKFKNSSLPLHSHYSRLGFLRFDAHLRLLQRRLHRLLGEVGLRCKLWLVPTDHWFACVVAHVVINGTGRDGR